MQEIEPEEQAGDLLIDEALFEEDKDDLPNEQLRNKSAAYLLWIKEKYNFLQKALDDIVQITSTLISAAVKAACVNIANKLLNMEEEEIMCYKTKHDKLHLSKILRRQAHFKTMRQKIDKNKHLKKSLVLL